MYSAYRKLIFILAAPVYLSFFFEKDVGREYGLGILDKLRLIWKFRRNNRNIPAASHWGEHLRLAAEILKIPRSVPGAVVECGCFKGGSSTNLSLVCAIVGRKLIICDSFEGLPEPREDDRTHFTPLHQFSTEYQKGMFSGGLDEVRANLGRWGDLSVCEFVKGFFETSLSQVKGPIAFAYLDVDLHQSLKDCLIALWPLLNVNARVYSHEALDLEFTALFFDKVWWQKNLNAPAPGFIGAGIGLPARVGEGSFTGFTIKRAAVGAH